MVAIDLRAAALRVIANAADGKPFPTGHSMPRIVAVRDVRAATGSGLKEALDAVDWAIEQHNSGSLDRHRKTTDTGWLYEFPNGHTASVINDPHRPFRFEVLSDDPDDAGRGGVVVGLASDEVEAKLRQIAALSNR
ncbi:hypothetical protein [Verrucosispora sp. NA02020]|uniref:hypothetical protein n=1 Tax=Verrucosispora sp. NA02020 TaxID=2742132 RepID=UPI00159083A0|nr:hypothetical protein [Verrucosispora sp. NA02020]QKW15430.1 hypothetical protein HUT12_23460 [Verrucosispora sp. NA02020]